MKLTRFEYIDSCTDAARLVVRVSGTSPPELRTSAAIRFCRRSRRYLITVAFIPNLIKSSGKNQIMFCGARQKIASRTPSSGITHPHPDDADPRARDRVDLGKAPVREAGDDRRHELRDAERNHQRV